MTTIIDSVSLIPYLASGKSRFYLRLFSTGPDDYAASTASPPFPVIGGTGPFSRVVSAALASDADPSLLPLVLFSQKDAYESEHPPSLFNRNPLVDEQWQKIFSRHNRSEAKSSLLLLKDQVSHDNRLLPFQSIFFCQFRRVFFPPVCPHCGHALHLCRDDMILNKFGLPPYSTTLARHLFCGPCIRTGEAAEFYVLAKNHDDPELLVKKDDLIRKMGYLKAGQTHGKTPLPCPDCSERKTCYSSESIVLDRISVFSFFPFYMLIFNADKIAEEDFKKLISGEVLTSLEPAPKKEDSPEGEPQGIVLILQRILRRWQAETGESPAVTEPSAAATQADSPLDSSPDHDLEPTRILTAKESKRITRPGTAAPITGQDLQKTVIVQKNRSGTGVACDSERPDLDKTRILRPVLPHAGPANHTAADHAGGLEKTRIIPSAPMKASSLSDNQGPVPETSGNRTAWSPQDLEGKTVAQKKHAPDLKKTTAPGENGILEKTVMIHRGKPRKKE